MTINWIQLNAIRNAFDIYNDESEYGNYCELRITTEGHYVIVSIWFRDNQIDDADELSDYFNYLATIIPIVTTLQIIDKVDFACNDCIETIRSMTGDELNSYIAAYAGQLADAIKSGNTRVIKQFIRSEDFLL